MPQLPAGEGQAPVESEPAEEVVERLAHLEQLVVQLKGLILDKDTQLIQKDTELANKDAQFKVNNLCVCLLSRLYSKHQLTIFFMPTSFMTKQHFSFFASYPQNEKEEFEARFTKLKLQAKAKMAALNKQITDLKGQGGATVSLNEAENSLSCL